MTPSRPPETFQVLLVEDNPGDVRLTREALKESKLLHELHVASDGEEAMTFLRRVGVHAAAPRPHLIILDLNLPRKDGRQVLEEIKADPELTALPIVVLTTSAAEEDILRSYELHANCYVTKPLDFGQFTHIVKSVEHFWFTIVTLPPR